MRYPSPFSPELSPLASPRPTEAPAMPPPPVGGNALHSQINKMSLVPGEAIKWARGPSPPPSMPSLPEQGGGLPPRGASLRRRGPSNSFPIPPQLPQLPFVSTSDSALPLAPGAPLPRSLSGRSVQSAPRSFDYDIPPVPQLHTPGSHLSEGSYTSHNPPFRSRSADPLRPAEPPSARFSSFPGHASQAVAEDDSPPMSPLQEDEAATLTGPAVISAQMKCKVFLKQSHQQWKSLGSGRLKLYAQKQGHIKQLVVESDSSSKAIMISTIVLTDGVERVAKTGVAVEISDKGQRTGIIYMIQLRNESSAAGLFESLLVGSDRAAIPR